MHRDSLGSRQAIRPGAVNWMTAGRGIAHSERTPPEVRQQDSGMFGVQLWVALPKAHEETAPASIITMPPLCRRSRARGCGFGSSPAASAMTRSPVATFTSTLCADAEIAAGAVLALPAEHEERSAYVLSGAVEIGGQRFEPGRLLVFRAGREVAIRALLPARLILLGGETMDGPRHVWWNFVSSSRERIEQAKAGLEGRPLRPGHRRDGVHSLAGMSRPCLN
jgi:Pirin-related protein